MPTSPPPTIIIRDTVKASVTDEQQQNATPDDDPTLARPVVDPAAMMGLGRSPAPGHWEPPSAAWLDERLAGYEVRGLLGRGGMGAVYRAWQTSLEREVAIKLLPPEMTGSTTQRERFIREARMLAKLRHPHIVSVHDFGELDDHTLYLVMELVEGGNLLSLMAQVKCPVEQTVSLLIELCEAVEAAHRAGLIHRDVKPANILITHDGHVKLADFGVARARHLPTEQLQLTATGTTVGTYHYIAPEVLDGKDLDDPRRDVYSVGVVLYQMLTGRLPRGAYVQVSRTEGVPAALDAIVERAMQADPAERYPTAAALAHDLRSLHLDRTKPRVPRRMMVGIAVALLLIACSILVMRNTDFLQTTPATDDASPRDGQATVVDDGDWQSLIAQVVPSRDRRAGQWQVDGSSLTCGTGPSILALPDPPGDSYDVRVRFTRLSGSDSVAVYFTVNGQRAMAELDAWGQRLAGVQDIDGRALNADPTSPIFAITNGVTYDWIVQVRPSEVTLVVDGRELHRYDLTGRTLSVNVQWQNVEQVRTPFALGIAAWDSPTRFHAIDVRSVRE